MPELVSEYIEMMGDMEFALSVGLFVFGCILFLGLLGKLFSKGKGGVNEKTPGSGSESPGSPLGSGGAAVNPSPEKTVAPDPLAGAMMWGGEKEVKKKSKPVSSPAVTAPPAPKPESHPPTEPPPQPESEAPARISGSAENKTVVIEPTAIPSSPVDVAPPVQSVSNQSLDDFIKEAEKTVVIPAKKDREPVVSDQVVEQKPEVDLHMFETILRRIAGVEAEVRKEPLYLDPLLKRVGRIEQRVEEIASSSFAKTDGTTNSTGTKDGSSDLANQMADLQKKVASIQKLVEIISEGTSLRPGS